MKLTAAAQQLRVALSTVSVLSPGGWSSSAGKAARPALDRPRSAR